MRKRTLSYIVDKLFWCLVVSLPLIIYALSYVHEGITLANVLSQFGISTNNVVYTALNGLFGTGGVLEFFNSTEVMLYFTYFVAVEIVHLAVDFLVFIPRLAHKFLNFLTRSEDE